VDAGLAQKQKLDCALQLTRTVALDFNNALTSILGHTSHVLGQMEPNHPWRSSLLQVEKSAQKAAEIAHDLAAFSRQEKDSKVQVSGNLNEVLRRVVDLFRGQQTTIEWKLNLEGSPYSATFDEAKMQQALVKIVENATQAGSTRVLVMTRNRDVEEPAQDGTVKLTPGCYVCIEVNDNGCGITPELLPRIFEPFFSTKPGHRGLGLAWVYGIITNHGGSLAVTSQPSTGTTARIYLPAQRKVMRDKKFRDDELRGTETILIVDDEDLLLTLGQMVLASAGYTVLTANSGEKALELLSKPGQRVDLIITDMVMPNMSGRELIERVRVLKPQVRIICSSGYMRANGREEDDEAYLQKPFTSQDMLTRVKQSLTRG
jgi:CheY-like chemotaxis protein